jgi:hypothetical protein
MGILSRKMALPVAVPTNPQHFKEVIAVADTKKYGSKGFISSRLAPKFEFNAPVLGNKSYTAAKLAQMKVLDSGRAEQNQEYNESAIVYSKKNSIVNDSINEQYQSNGVIQTFQINTGVTS